nr:RecName: Full=Uncharacterized protein IMPP7 [Nautilus macromphalus]
TFVSSQVSGPR